MLLRRGSRATSFDFGHSRSSSFRGSYGGEQCAEPPGVRSVSLDLRGKEVPQINNSPLLCKRHRLALSQVMVYEILL